MQRVGLHADVIAQLTVAHKINTLDHGEEAGFLMARLREICAVTEAIVELESVSPVGRGELTQRDGLVP